MACRCFAAVIITWSNIDGRDFGPATEVLKLLLSPYLRFIANMCKQYVESEMTDRSTLVWELLRVKDGLSCLSNEQFNVLDVCSVINWLCTY